MAYLHGKVNVISTVENSRTVDFNSREMAEYVSFTDLKQQNIHVRKTTASKRVTLCVAWKGLENEGCGCVGVVIFLIKKDINVYMSIISLH
jgi:hypothetical protein